jgi:GLPGLI family protein
MKKHFFLILLFLPFFSYAQQAMEGTVRYLVTHDWVKKMSHLEYMSKQARERASYMWGNRSQWKVYTNLHFTTTESKYEDSEEKAEADEEGGYSWRKETFFIKRNFEKQTGFGAIEMLGKTYIIEDTLSGYDWKIQNDLKEVAGHVCMKAFVEDTLKKHKIVAWFAQDIPLDAGPEGYYGLPGLILELDYNDGAMTVTADKIDLKKLVTELEIPKKLKGKKVKDADFQLVIKNHIADKRKEEQPWFWGVRY